MKFSLALCVVLLTTTVATAAQIQVQTSTVNSTSTTPETPDTSHPKIEPTPAPTPTVAPIVAPPKTPDETHAAPVLPVEPELIVPRAAFSPASLPTLQQGDVEPFAPTEVDADTSAADTAAAEESPDETVNRRVDVSGFHWSNAIKQSLLFLTIQHGYALTQPKTRRDLHGPFLKDYFRSVKSLHGWGDGGRFFTNYIAHPMQGSLVGFIQIQNDPSGINRRFGKSGDYWRSRLKALAWSAAWSTQFEIGPISQASVGNVGMHGKQTYVDLVMTPTAGLGLLIAEDAIDRYVIRKIERTNGNFYLKITSRTLLNPTRTVANLIRFKKPWHRDAGLR